MMQDCVDRNLLAEAQQRAVADNDDDDEDDADVPSTQLPKALSARDDRAVKALARSLPALRQGLLREERGRLWRGVYVRREAESGAQANADFYQETLRTCFGSTG